MYRAHQFIRVRGDDREGANPFFAAGSFPILLNAGLSSFRCSFDHVRLLSPDPRLTVARDLAAAEINAATGSLSGLISAGKVRDTALRAEVGRTMGGGVGAHWIGALATASC